jgi:hypothetical protein
LQTDVNCIALSLLLENGGYTDVGLQWRNKIRIWWRHIRGPGFICVDPWTLFYSM